MVQCNAKHLEKGVGRVDIRKYLTAERESTSGEKQPKPPANSEDEREPLHGIQKVVPNKPSGSAEKNEEETRRSR